MVLIIQYFKGVQMIVINERIKNKPEFIQFYTPYSKPWKTPWNREHHDLEVVTTNNRLFIKKNRYAIDVTGLYDVENYIMYKGKHVKETLSNYARNH
jgi:hypothetical protein